MHHIRPAADRRGLSSFLALLLLAAPALAFDGLVTTPDGDPVEGARVRLLPYDEEATEAPRRGVTLATTDRGGSFSFPGVEPPLRLWIEHPRFEHLTVEIAPGDEPMITLTPKQQLFDEIVVTAGRERGGGVQPVSVATTSIAPGDRPAPAATVVELIEGTPGVAESGQGGLFQAYSIRGVAGQRVQSLVGGARIVTERRAGSTASFVDPLLLSEIDVVRGPYSSFYGSGALGGVVQALPARFRELTLDTGYASQGNASHARVGLGGESWSLGLAYRGSGNTETPSGALLFSEFQQGSASFLQDFELANGLEAELLILPAIGRDIGKPNARYPSRITSYPEENHLVTRFTLRRPGSWRLDLWAHPNELQTLNLRSTRRDVVDNQAFDFGANLQRAIDLPRQWTAQVGVDYFGRRGVEATQRTEEFETGEITAVTTLDGSEDEGAVFGSLRRSFGRVDLELGARLTWLGQDNAGAASTSDSAGAGFVGLTVPLKGGLELAANLGTGLRFPGLSERYFTGTTGRGEVIANPDLDPERSLSGDLGLRWYGRRVFVAAYGFRNEIDDYIEQVELDTGVASFENLTSGTLEGFELEGFFQASDELRLTWTGQTVRGRGDGGQPLADVAPDRIEGGLVWEHDAWTAAGRWQHRFSKDDPGPGEQEVAAAEVVSASVAYRFANQLRVSLTGSNLLDEEYLPSADELSVPAAGRSIGLGLSWQR